LPATVPPLPGLNGAVPERSSGRSRSWGGGRTLRGTPAPLGLETSQWALPPPTARHAGETRAVCTARGGDASGRCAHRTAGRAEDPRGFSGTHGNAPCAPPLRTSHPANRPSGARLTAKSLLASPPGGGGRAPLFGESGDRTGEARSYSTGGAATLWPVAWDLEIRDHYPHLPHPPRLPPLPAVSLESTAPPSPHVARSPGPLRSG
jgi:hypothetical protein